MVEYALISAGNVLVPLRVHAERLAGSVGLAEMALIAAGVWVLWRVLDRLIGPRTG